MDWPESTEPVLTVAPRGYQRHGGKVGPAELQGAFLQAGYYDDYWPKRAQALSAYLKGDPKPLVEQAGPATGAAAEAETYNAV